MSAEEWSVMTSKNEGEIFVAYREVCVECLRKFLINPHYDIHHSSEIRGQKLMNTQEKCYYTTSFLGFIGETTNFFRYFLSD